MMTEETEENPDGAEMMIEEIVIVETDPRQMLAADSRTWQRAILCLCSTCQIFQNLREKGDLVTHIQEWKIKTTVFLHLASPGSIIEEVLEVNMMEVSFGGFDGGFRGRGGRGRGGWRGRGGQENFRGGADMGFRGRGGPRGGRGGFGGQGNWNDGPMDGGNPQGFDNFDDAGFRGRGRGRGQRGRG